MGNLELIDFAVFFLVLSATIASVVFGIQKRSENNFLDHLLMGRKLTLPLFTATLVATWYGGIFGVAEIAFNEGLYNFITQGVFWYLSYIVFALFILPKIKQKSYSSLPELVSSRMGRFAGNWTASLNIFNLLPIAYIISLGKFLSLVFDIHFELGMVLGLLTVLSYSLFGGFRSVVYSDIVQFFVMLISVIMVFIFAIFKFGITKLSVLPESYFSFTGKSSLGETFMWGLIAFGTLVDPNFYQRSYAAMDVKTAQKGILLSTLIWLIFDISLTVGAMYAKATGALDYFNFSLNLLPIGLKGFFLAGLLATILSTLDSYLFLAGSTFSVDLIKSKSTRTQKISIVMIAFISLALAFNSNGSIKSVWKFLGSLSSAALLFPMLGFYFLKNFKTTAFMASSILGAFTTLYFTIFPNAIEPIYYGLAASMITALAIYLINQLRSE